jgi:hypothetical protein
LKTQIGRANQRSWKKRKKTQKALISFGGGDEALYFVIYTLATYFHKDDVNTKRVKKAYLLSLENLQHYVLYRPDRIDGCIKDKTMQGKFDLLP